MAISKIKAAAWKALDTLTYDDTITKADIDVLKTELVRASRTLTKIIKSDRLTNKEKAMGIISAVLLLLPLDMLPIAPEVAKFIDDIVVMMFVLSKKKQKRAA